MIDLYSALYHVERTATERNLGAIGRHALRQAESVPWWREFGQVITDITSKVEKKAPLGKAIHYWTRQQPALHAFLDDGRFPISYAHVERLLRVVSTFRKNSLFVGSLDAGQRYANLLTVLLNCELAGVAAATTRVTVVPRANAWTLVEIPLSQFVAVQIVKGMRATDLQPEGCDSALAPDDHGWPCSLAPRLSPPRRVATATRNRPRWGRNPTDGQSPRSSQSRS